MPFKHLIVLLLRKLSKSIQRELDIFSKEVMGSEFNIGTVTKGAFSKARRNLKPSAFIELSEGTVDAFYKQRCHLEFLGHRLLAVDGSRLLLPNHPSIKEEFGEHGWGPNADSMRSMASISLLYDPLNLVTIDAQIASYASSERELLMQHLSKVKAGDLLLLDRGYPSIALFFILKALGIEFCVRMKEDWWLSVKQFVESGKKECFVEFQLPNKDIEKLKDYPGMKEQSIRCRLVLVELENGEKQVLCSSLLDQNKYPLDCFRALYHYRWNEEEAYKLFKTRVEIENFSGKTAKAVQQDFFAGVYMMNLCAILAFPIEEKVKKESYESKNKHQKKINRTSTIAMFRDICVGIFIKKKIKEGLRAFDDLVSQTTEIIRPGRKVPRKKKPRKQYSMNYKQL